jgi:hypothetical protein
VRSGPVSRFVGAVDPRRPGLTELVLRVLRGEALDAVSRESQVPAHELEIWKRVFFDGRPAIAELGGVPAHNFIEGVIDGPNNQHQPSYSV